MLAISLLKQSAALLNVNNNFTIKHLRQMTNFVLFAKQDLGKPLYTQQKYSHIGQTAIWLHSVTYKIYLRHDVNFNTCEVY